MLSLRSLLRTLNLIFSLNPTDHEHTLLDIDIALLVSPPPVIPPCSGLSERVVLRPYPHKNSIRRTYIYPQRLAALSLSFLPLTTSISGTQWSDWGTC